jgi:ADP-ribose pyrophosphatase YjhB (NUDIX family)
MPNLKTTLKSFFKFCPHCGKSLGLKKIHGQTERVCPACGFVFWLNSKPTASLLLVQKGQVLLAKRAINPNKGEWDLPGGFLEIDERPEKGLQREIREELGIRIIRPTFFGIYLGHYASTPPQATFNVYYLSTHFTGTLKPQDDVTSLAWHPLKRLPKKIAFANNRQALRDLRVFLKR